MDFEIFTEDHIINIQLITTFNYIISDDMCFVKKNLLHFCGIFPEPLRKNRKYPIALHIQFLSTLSKIFNHNMPIVIHKFPVFDDPANRVWPCNSIRIFLYSDY